MSEQDFYFRDSCRLCDSKHLEKVIELTPTPPGNNFLTKDQLDDPEPRYPLELYFCVECFHLQLGHVVDPSILYRSNYHYVSGTSPVFVAHLRDYAAHMISKFQIAKGALIADIGSNDGTCLRGFQEAGCGVVGVDPASDIAKKATDSGVPTIDAFFSSEVARRMRDEHGPAKLVTSHNACAHIDDLKDVMLGAKHWLADDGLLCIEVGYLLDVYQNTWFDTMYHEHLDYHSVAPLVTFFASLGMPVVRVERVAPQGGSIRVIAQKEGGPYQADGTAQQLVTLEAELGLNSADTFRAFNDKINRVKQDLSELVRKLKLDGATIAAYGAPTKSTTLLTHFDLGDLLDFIVDDNPLKQGTFSPGFHIPVLAADTLYDKKPDYVVVLAWNFAEPIMKKHARYRDGGGRWILPMPEARIAD